MTANDRDSLRLGPSCRAALFRAKDRLFERVHLSDIVNTSNVVPLFAGAWTPGLTDVGNILMSDPWRSMRALQEVLHVLRSNEDDRVSFAIGLSCLVRIHSVLASAGADVPGESSLLSPGESSLAKGVPDPLFPPIPPLFGLAVRPVARGVVLATLSFECGGKPTFVEAAWTEECEWGHQLACWRGRPDGKVKSAPDGIGPALVGEALLDKADGLTPDILPALTTAISLALASPSSLLHHLLHQV